MRCARSGPVRVLALPICLGAGLLLAACGGAAPGGGGSAGGTAAQTVAHPNPTRAGAPTVTIHECTPKLSAGSGDPCWKGATATPLTNVMAGSMPGGFAATFQAVWDAKNLYLLEAVTNPQGFDPSNANTANPWKSDAMEVYLSGDNGADTSMGGNDTQIDIPLGSPSSVWVFPNQSAAGVQASVTKTAKGYDAVMAIPWSDVPGLTAAGVGQVVGADPAADTYSDGSSQNQAIAWGNPGSSEQNPSIWGQLVLAK